MIKVKPNPKEYSAKETKRFTRFSETLPKFASNYALELAVTELMIKTNDIISKKVEVTIPFGGGFCQIKARIVSTAPIITVLSVIQF